MPKCRKSRTGVLLSRATEMEMAKSLEFELGVCQEFGWRAPRSFKTWPVDNLWISMEFGEFGGKSRITPFILPLI